MLGAAKTESGKYGELWDKVGKQLATSQNTANEAATRIRVIEPTSREVDFIEAPSVIDELMLLPALAAEAVSADAE